MNVDLHLGDCRGIMPTLETDSVDAVITDPPYGEDIGSMGYTNNVKGGVTLRNDYSDMGDWDKKRIDITTLLDIGKFQVIWGGNFYSNQLPVSRCWLIWDKKKGGQYSNDFADCEMAWTNQDKPSRLMRHLWHGMIQQDMKHKESRYHPTQKPIPVMRWCLELFTNPGDVILDPFMGVGTTGVACIQMGRNFIGIEIEPKYFEIAEKRIAEAQLQMRMPI